MRKLIATLLCNSILFPFLAFADEEGNNSIVDQQIQYADYNYIHNIENGALNPVSISDIPLGDITVISAGYYWNNGKYHNVDKSGHVNGFDVDVYGIARLNKISFEGEVGYLNYKERDRAWNSTLFQNKLNPFILADDKPSDYKIDRFVINGRFAYKLSSRVRFGLNADYNVGVMSDEKDPRVETKGMRFILNPGIDFDVTNKFKLGATGGINLFSESQRYTCLQTAVNYKFYLMSGLGTYYPNNNNAYSRDSKGTSWFVSIDGKYQINDDLSNYLTINYGNEAENAVDGGSSYRFMGGDFSNKVIGVTDRFAITQSRVAHNIEIGFQINDVNGKWYNQKSTTQNGTVIWEIMGSSIKHKESLTTAHAGYRFDILDNNGVSNLTAGIGFDYTNSDTKNYPDVYFRKYSNLAINANVTKYFNIGKVRLSAGIDGGYKMNMSSSCDLNGSDIAAEDYALPMYYFLTSNAYKVNGKIEGKLPVGKVILGAFVSGGTTRCANAKEMYNKTSINNINCGLNLSF